MDERDDLRREIEEVLDEMTDEAGIGIARSPSPEPLPAAPEEAPDPHGHGHAGMITFGAWEDDEEGNLVEGDPGRFGRYDPDAERPPDGTPAEHADAPHAGGGHAPPAEPPTRRPRARRKPSQ